jgi:SIT4-associating protein SAP185/190
MFNFQLNSRTSLVSRGKLLDDAIKRCNRNNDYVAIVASSASTDDTLSDVTAETVSVPVNTTSAQSPSVDAYESPKASSIASAEDHTEYLKDVLKKVLASPSFFIGELLSTNTTYLEFFQRPEILSLLVQFILAAPYDTNAPNNTDDVDEDEDQEGTLAEQDNLNDIANNAFEIFVSGIDSLDKALLAHYEYLDQFWAILDLEDPDNTKISYLSRITSYHLDQGYPELIKYIQHQNNFVQRFIRHIENPPVMDVLLKIISSDNPETPNGIIEFLQYQRLIPLFIDKLSPDHSFSVQSASGDFIKALVGVSANSHSDNTNIGPNELTRELVSEPCVNELVRLMLQGGSSLSTGVGIVIEIIRKNNSDYDIMPVVYFSVESRPPTSRDPIYLGTLLKVFKQNLPKFYDLLTKNHDERLKTAFGQIEPLGFERFKICELVAELLHCSNMALLNDLNGEQMVRTRDIERVRIRKHHYEVEGGYPPLEYPGPIVDAGDEKNVQLAGNDLAENDEGGANSTASQNMAANSATEAQPEESTDATKVDVDAETPKEFADKSSSTDLNGTSQDHFSRDTETIEASSPETMPKPTIEVHNPSIVSDDFQSLSISRSTDSSDPPVVILSKAEIRANPVIGDQIKIAFFDTNIIDKIISMFFEFPWNNFLHNVVFDIVQQILNGPMDQGFNRYLTAQIFDTGHITDLISESEKLCKEYFVKHKTRLGYMGHLTLISEAIVKFATTFDVASFDPAVKQALESPEWKNYIENSLVHTREQYSYILGGEMPSEEASEYHSHAIILRNDDQPMELEQDSDDDGDDDDDEEEYRQSPHRFVDSDNDEDEDEYFTGGHNPDNYGGSRGNDNEKHLHHFHEHDHGDENGGSTCDNDNETSSFTHNDSNDNNNNNLEETNDEDDVDDYEDDDDDGLSLVRSKSYNTEMSWDPEETQKIVETLHHISQTNSNGSN